MNNLSKNLTLLYCVTCLVPDLAQAKVTGVWDTTALTRIDITPIKAPKQAVEHSIDIADGSYEFDNYGDFYAGDISGYWLQNKNQYSVKVDRYNLENQFRQGLEAQTPGLIVNQVKLLKSKFSGYELDDGIWGSESYEYRIDTSLDGDREIIRFVMTVNVAGYFRNSPPAQAATQPTPLKANAPQIPAAHSQIKTAVTAVLNHLNRVKASKQ